MRIIDDLYYTENKDPNRTLKLYLPEGENFPVVVYFHGGGLVGGDKSFDGDIIAPYLADNGVCLVSANYRMYPNAKYPDFIEDAAAAVAWVRENISTYGGGSRLFVGGSSAGGYLSLMLCFASEYLGKYNISPMDIDCFIHDAGQPTVHFNILAERGLDTRRIIVDEAAPLFHIGNAGKYPPMLIIHSDGDIKNRPEELRLLVSALRNFGHEHVEIMERHGGHTHYIIHQNELGEAVGTFDDDGYCPFSKMILPFIQKHLD